MKTRKGSIISFTYLRRSSYLDRINKSYPLINFKIKIKIDASEILSKSQFSLVDYH